MKYLLTIPLFLFLFAPASLFADDGQDTDRQEVISSSFVVSDGGSVTITAGDKIVLKPGTKVTAGGTLRASIAGTDIKSIKKKTKERPLDITKEEQEKVEEHARLEIAFDLFRHYARATQGVYTEEKEKESFTLQSSHTYGISSGQQRNVAAGAGMTDKITSQPFISKSPVCRPATTFRPVAVMALRL